MPKFNFHAKPCSMCKDDINDEREITFCPILDTWTELLIVASECAHCTGKWVHKVENWNRLRNIGPLMMYKRPTTRIMVICHSLLSASRKESYWQKDSFWVYWIRDLDFYCWHQFISRSRDPKNLCKMSKNWLYF